MILLYICLHHSQKQFPNPSPDPNASPRYSKVHHSSPNQPRSYHATYHVINTRYQIPPSSDESLISFHHPHLSHAASNPRSHHRMNLMPTHHTCDAKRFPQSYDRDPTASTRNP